MTNKQFDTMYNGINDKAASRFEKLATYIVDNHCTTLEKTPIIGKDRAELIYVTGYDLAYGSAYTKNKYITLGVICGVAVCSISIAVYNKISKKKKEES